MHMQISSVRFKELKNLKFDLNDTFNKISVIMAPSQHQISLQFLVPPYYIDIITGDIEALFFWDFGYDCISDDIWKVVVVVEFRFLKNGGCSADKSL